MRRLLVVMMGMTVLIPVRADAAGSHTVVVDDDLACAGAAFSTIQAGIDAAQPGDFVAICAGVYPEQLTITKNLTLTPYSGDALPVVALERLFPLLLDARLSPVVAADVVVGPVLLLQVGEIEFESAGERQLRVCQLRLLVGQLGRETDVIAV